MGNPIPWFLWMMLGVTLIVVGFQGSAGRMLAAILVPYELEVNQSGS